MESNDIEYLQCLAEKLPASLKNELLGHMRKASIVSTKSIDLDDTTTCNSTADAPSQKDGTLDDKVSL